MSHKMLALLLAAAVAPALPALDVDLAGYLKLVEDNNKGLQVARTEVSQTEQVKKEAFAALLPNAGLQAGYTRNLNEISQPVASYATASAMPGVYPITYTDQVVSYNNELDLAAGLNFTIFDAAAYAHYDQATEGVSARRAGYDYQRKATLNAARKLYYQALLLGEVVKVKESAEKNAHDSYSSVQARFAVGLTTELDALLAEVEWKGKSPETAEARRNRDVALLGFKQLAGIAPDQQVVLTESMETYPAAPPEPPFTDVLAARSDYALLLHQRTLAELSVKAANASYYPTVSGSFAIANQRFSNEWGFNDYAPLAVQLGLKVTLPVYEGGYRPAKISEEEMGLAKCNTEIAQKQEDISRELTSARLSLDEAGARIQNASSVLGVARRAFDKATVSFANGVATQLQLNQASLNLEGSHLAYLAAVYDYLAAYFDWELAAGQ